MTDKIHCGKCRMCFKVEEPPRSDIERMRCPDCSRSFWSFGRGGVVRGPAVIGVTPEQAERWERESAA